MKTKPQTVRLKLSASFHTLPFISEHTPEFICFDREENARHFSRNRAAQILRRIRSWGNYYKMEVA
jgi:hypothetical protein